MKSQRFSPCMVCVLAVLTLVLLTPIALLGQADEPPTNSLIAFVSLRDDTSNSDSLRRNSNIYLMSVDGSRIQQLTANRGSDFSPSWSPDGQSLLYTSDRDGQSNLLMRHPLAGGNPSLISSTDPEVPWPLGSDAVFSPDSTQIAFTVGDHGGEEIFIMNADGSNIRNITATDLDKERFPSWSPDGTHIAYTLFVFEDYDWDISIANLDGSGQRRLTGRGDDAAPAWSPDGSRIAYTSNRDGDDDIFIMNADGSNPVNLTRNEGSDSSPTWSPDGAYIAFTSNRDGNSQIYVMRADGSDQHNVSNNPFEDYNPVWSPFLSDTLPTLPPTTATPFPVTRTPTVSTCPDAPPSRLNVGMTAYVVTPVAEGDERRNLRVRNQPGGEVIGIMEPGTDFRIIGQPQCGDDGLMWWEIETLDGSLRGWSVEGFAPDDYLMIPYS